MSSIAIENQITTLEQELGLMLSQHNAVEQEKLKLQREILELQLKKKDYEIVLDKSKHNIRQRELQIKILTKQFWSAKNSGL